MSCAPFIITGEHIDRTDQSRPNLLGSAFRSYLDVKYTSGDRHNSRLRSEEGELGGNAAGTGTRIALLGARPDARSNL